MFNYLTGTGGCVFREVTSGIYRSVDTGVDIFCDDGTELASAGIDQLISDLEFMVFTVVAEIGYDRSGTEVDAVHYH